MFVPRTNDESDSCPPGHVSCSPSNIAITGSGTSSDDPAPPSTTYIDDKPAHRFIGIGMVIAMAVVVILLWFYFAKFPRRKFPVLYRCGARRTRDESSTTIAVGALSSTSDKLKDLGTESSGSEDDTMVDDEEAAVAGRRGGNAGARDDARKSRRSSRRSRAEKAAASADARARAKALARSRNQMLQAEPRGVVKEVSGGVVMYTEAPRAAVLPARDRYPTDWAFEQVHGVCFEARSPHRHSRSKPASPRS